MYQFRVKSGVHVEDGTKYKKGEIVSTHYDLTKLFPEKFELVSADLAPDPAPAELQVEEEVIPEPEPPPPRKPTPAPRRKKANTFTEDQDN